MTLGRLIELYKAEQEGKQIMKIEFNIYNRIKIGTMPIKLSEYELNNHLSTEGSGVYYNFFIKVEEDENGNKIK